MKIFVTADLHLGHRKLLDIRSITDDQIVNNWNSVVSKRDVVYVLGDVFKIERLSDMLGIKKLILGNHDKYPVVRYLEYFSSIHAMKEYDNCLLTHIPIHMSQSGRYRLNVHGHTHNNKIDHPFYRCVSLEHTNYTPVLLNEVIK